MKKEIILFLISFLICFSVFELIIVPGLFHVNSPTVYLDDSIGRILKPGYNSRTREDFSIEFIVNSEGFYDIGHELENDENAVRIVILGDSYIEATQVTQDKTYFSILQQKVNNECKNKIEIFSFGIYAFSPDNEYLMYHKYIRKYKPDAVLVGFVINDIENMYLGEGQGLKTTLLRENGKLIISPKKENKGIIRKLKEFIKRNFYLNTIELVNLTFAKMSLEKNISEKYDKKPLLYHLSIPATPNIDKQWKILFEVYSLFEQDVKNDGGEFILFSIPQTDQIETIEKQKFMDKWSAEDLELDLDRIDHTLAEYSKNNNINFYALEPYMKKCSATLGQQLRWENDGHWNIAGHYCAAVIFLDILKSEGYCVT